jgi:hypothetical protein
MRGFLLKASMSEDLGGCYLSTSSNTLFKDARRIPRGRVVGKESVHVVPYNKAGFDVQGLEVICSEPR